MNSPHILKTHYRIGELSQLYDISTDSLRYYERLGLLSPERQENGYRVYSLKDLNTLTLIRDLRALGVSMEQIASRLREQTVSSTEQLLSRMRSSLAEERCRLERQEAVLRRQLDRLAQATTLEDRTFRIQHFDARPCLRIFEHITTDEEIDFLLRELQRKEEDHILTISSQMTAATLSIEDLQKGTANVYTSVFFILEPSQKASDDTPTTAYDFVLPAGDYLSYVYRGGYQQNPERLQELYLYAKKHALTLDESVFEIYWADNRDTLHPDEFVTEMQVQIL